MDFGSARVVGHEAYFHERFFLEVWFSIRDPQSGNDHIAVPKLQVSGTRISLALRFSRNFTRNFSSARARRAVFESRVLTLFFPTDEGLSEIRDTKTFNLLRNIVSLQVCVDVSRFSPCVINLSRNKNICCGLKKVVAKSRARVYFEQQILALFLVFHEIHNLSRNKFARALANQPISAFHFFNLQQMFLLRVKLITQVDHAR